MCVCLEQIHFAVCLPTGSSCLLACGVISCHIIVRDLQEHQPGVLQVSVPHETVSVPDIFCVLQHIVDEINVSSYSIQHISLDGVSSEKSNVSEYCYAELISPVYYNVLHCAMF